MDSKENSLQEPPKLTLDYLDTMKFVSGNTRTTIKRKENPIEIKYEQSTTKSTFKKETETPFKSNRENFQYIYDKIKEMRKDLSAAVDKYGCRHNADHKALKDVQDFQLLVSLIISVQNRDESTATAMERLKAFGLDAENINKTDEAKVLEVMGGVNFNKTKAKNIKAAAKLIVEKYNNKVPNDWKLLLEFPGVGNKIAIIFLNTAYNMNVGIGVDTHVHRVCNRIGLVHNTKTPDHTRVELESLIPREEWSEINNWFVGFGQQICLPINPKCGTCLINDICNEGRKILKKDTKVEMKLVKEKEEIQTKIEDGIVKEEDMDVKYTKQLKMESDGYWVKEEAIEINLKKEENENYEMSSEIVKIEEEEAEPKKKKVLMNKF